MSTRVVSNGYSGYASVLSGGKACGERPNASLYDAGGLNSVRLCFFPTVPPPCIVAPEKGSRLPVRTQGVEVWVVPPTWPGFFVDKVCTAAFAPENSRKIRRGGSYSQEGLVHVCNLPCLEWCLF